MKQKISFSLSSDPSTSFKCIKAAQSVDLDLKKKLKYDFSCEIDLPDNWNLGVIYGNSGSGKSTVSQYLFPKDSFVNAKPLDPDLTILDHFPDDLDYNDCANLLCSLGLSQVPCWLRPVKTLSNGQKHRAEIAYNLALNKEKIIIIDEWTSVVDRMVAKIMSHTIAKFISKTNRKIVLCSCHEDIIEWIQPDWMLNCNDKNFRRLVRQPRSEKLYFKIYKTNRNIWPLFSQYHYLSDKIPGGLNFIYGLFNDQMQPIGCIFYSNYITNKSANNTFHANRIVIHPDYCGFNLGGLLLNKSAALLKKEYPELKLLIKFSSLPVLKLLLKYSDKWRPISKDLTLFTQKGTNLKSRRKKIYTYSFQYMH